MHEYTFSKAALPDAIHVLKLPLLPYSLGHHLWLTRRRSSFLDASRAESPTKHDLVEAVLICSQTMREIEASQRDRWLGFKTKIILFRNRGGNLDHEISKFQSYLLDGLAWPPTSLEPRKPGDVPRRTPGAPVLLRLFQFISSRPFNYEVESPWDFPLSLAHWHWCAHWESEGAIRIDNIEDAQRKAFSDYVRDKPVNHETLAAAKAHIAAMRFN